jgi:molybdopterin molybdotransferase
MITVEEALARIFALVEETGTEDVRLSVAAGRVLAEPVTARRDQPPFRTAVMDGYAVRGAEVAVCARFRIVGEAPAGRSFSGAVGPGEAVRIYTGAPVPEGADHVVIQEDVDRDGDRITLGEQVDLKPNVRAPGADFRVGDRVEVPRRLSPADLALIAAMNVPDVTVRRRPVVAILPTGDELAMPGGEPGPDQIIASNAFALKALVEAEGAEARMLPIARDTTESLAAAFRLAAGADLLLTIGGASVGDYDLVGAAAEAEGVTRAFYKVAMRPGKPLMAGKAGRMVMIGLPGNPVSAIVCGVIFVLPAIRAMLGLGRAPAPRLTAPLAGPLEPNGPREHYMRAVLSDGRLTAMDSQDSSLLGILSRSNALIVRPVDDGPRVAGDVVEYLAF